ncbi:MAG: acyl-CoA thioesterase [Rhizobium sp.]|nr:acyl-CoA thioesterase [Rhizobium sp.]
MSEGEPAGGPAPTTLIDIVFPGATNHHGTLFGGAGLSAMDRVAFVAATRQGRVPFVTASCERVEFKKPAHVGEIVSFVATPIWAGRRSLTVEVEMLAEAISTGERHLCTRGVFHMVASLDPPLRETWSLPPLATTHDVPPSGEVRMADVVFSDQTNSSGAMFGGDAIAFMTKAAFVAASRLCRKLAVLASSERLDFHHPIGVGSIVEAVARVVSVGRASMAVEVELWAEGLLSGERCRTAKGLFVMVAVDEYQRPVPVIPDEFGTGAS